MRFACLLLGIVLAVTAIPQRLPAQQQEAKGEGARLAEDLVNACLREAALRPARDPKTGELLKDSKIFKNGRLEIGDWAKLKTVLKTNRPLLTQECLHALIGMAKLAGPEEAPVFLHLLRQAATEVDNEVAMTVAANEAARLGWPRPTDAGKTALQQLVRRAIENDGLQWVQETAKTSRLIVKDGAKLKVTLAAHQALLHPELIETAMAVSNAVDHAVLLRAIGQELPDLRAAAYGAYLNGSRQVRERHFAQGVRELKDAVERFGKLRDNHWKSMSLWKLGSAQVELGDEAEALTNYQQAVGLLREIHGPKYATLARIYHDLGAAASERGEYQRALDSYLKAGECLGSVDADPELVAALIHDMAFVLAAQGDTAFAVERYQWAMQLFQQLHGDQDPSVATCLKNLGRCYLRERDLDRARDHFDRALAIRLNIFGAVHKDVAYSLLDLGQVCALQKQYGLALYCHQQALSILRRLYGSQHPTVALAWRELGHDYRHRGDRDKALQAFDRALLVLRVDPKLAPPVADLRLADYRVTPALLTLLKLRGDLLRELAARERDHPKQVARLRECAKAYALAAEGLDQLRPSLRGEDDQIHASEEVFALFPAWLGVCQQLARVEGEPKRLEEVYSIAESATARVFLQTLGRSVNRSIGGVSPELQEQERQLLSTLHRLNRQRLDAWDEAKEQYDTTRLTELAQEYRRVDRQLSQLRARMETDSPRYAALKQSKPCTLAEARSVLRDNEVALFYVLGPIESYVLLLEKEPRADDPAKGLALYPLPAADVIAAKVAALTDPNDLENRAIYVARSRDLYELLIAPVRDRLTNRNLVIIPSGALCGLPFEMLLEPGESSGGHRFLVEGRHLRYAPSLTTLHLLRRWDGARNEQPDQPLWALGDPVYDASDPRAPNRAKAVMPKASQLTARLGRPAASGDGSGYSRLVHTRAEVEAIRKLLNAPAEAVLLDLQSTETAVKSASARGDLQRARYVHFAVHGTLDAEAGRQPSLVLNLVGNDSDDGFLELDEVTHLNLNADLVVLSSCRSARGELNAGEGMRGLARAFLHAGSRAVVCSLWPVEDQETAEFMKVLYRELKAGKRAPEALREAQLAMIKAGKPPLFWAAFILIGE